MRSQKPVTSRFAAVVLTAAAACALGACSGYDVELNAPVLNAVGLDFGKKAPPPPPKDRAPLVMPPSAKLPEPGKVAAAPDDMNWPDDPDVRAAKLAKLKEEKDIAEGKKKGPWNKLINSAFGTGEQANKKDDPEQAKTEEEEKEKAVALPGESSSSSGGYESNIDMEERTRDMIR